MSGGPENVPEPPPPPESPPSPAAAPMVFVVFAVLGVIAMPCVAGVAMEARHGIERLAILAVAGLAPVVLAIVGPSVYRRAAGAGFFVGLAGALVALVTWIMNTSFTKGRVLRIEGGASKRARIVPREGWTFGASLDFTALSAQQRSVVAGVWQTFASMEHASVPAFGKLGERLVALGASADLVERAYAAALDEVRHAKRCLDIASSLAGRPLGPAPLDALREERPRARRTTQEALHELALASLEDGALAEGIAARVAATCAARSDASLVDTFEEIARDEAEHARLGRDVIDFCLAASDSALLPKLRDKLAALEARDPGTSALALVHAPYLEAYGVLAPSTLQRIRRDVLTELRTWLAAKGLEQEREESVRHRLA